ncbi:MAG: hypothetical protein ACKORL_11510 [Phycisphaerales bacterium]
MRAVAPSIAPRDLAPIVNATATTSGQRAGTATPFAPVLPAAATRTAPCDMA